MDGTEGVTDIEGDFIVGSGRCAGVSLTEMVGISDGRLIAGALKLWPLVTEGDSLTEIVGTACVVEILLKRPRGGAVAGAGVSLTEMLGTGVVTPAEEMLPLRPWLDVVVSLTEIVGILDTDCGLLKRPRLAGRDSLTDMLGTGGWGRDDGVGSAYGSAGTEALAGAVGSA